MPVPPFTPRPGGYVTARTLDDGRYLIEGWALNMAPSDGGEPRHDIACHWIAHTPDEATATIAEFAGYLNIPLGVTA